MAFENVDDFQAVFDVAEEDDVVLEDCAAELWG